MSLGFLRSILIADPLIVLATVVMGSISVIVSFFDPTGRVQLRIARAWARMLVRIVGVKLDVEGLEKISAEGSYVFVSNHASYMDTPVILSVIPVQFRFLAKKELFRVPFLGHHLKRAGHIPVPRESPREAVKTMNEAGRIIRERRISLLIFPEGGRSRTGELGPFKEGAAYIAIKAGVPLVPIGLQGTRDVLPFGSGHVRAGHVRLRIGDPIPSRDLTSRDRSRITQELYGRVSELVSENPLYSTL